MEGAVFNLPGRLDELLRRHRSILPKGAEDEIPLIKQDLEEIVSILHGHCSEAKLEDHAMVVRCWMKEVRELSYDIEDCIDQYEECIEQYEHITAARYYIRRRKFNRRHGNRLPPWVPERLKQRLWMANKIREFSLRVQEVIQRYAMYKNDLSGIASIAAAATTTTIISDVSSSSSWHPAPGGKCGYAGIDAAMNKIEAWLTDEEHKKLKVVSIVGVGGVGKTTLANELYLKLGHQFKYRAFVRSSHKPDMRSILISMLSRIHPQQPPAIGRYLIIIDDLWSTSTWDIISRTLPPDGNSCSRILTTTEIEDLALQSCSYDSKYIFKMKPLGEEDSRNLFFSTVFGSRPTCPPELSEVSYDIVKKCGGLPLAVVTIASLLASQLEKQEQWDYINKTLGYSLMANPNLEGMKQLLSLCYNSLPQHLKACMLYFSTYQEDTIIWKDDLVNQWIAEGFICAIEGHDKEEISRAYFDELVDKKIIQPVHINDNGEVLSCVVHYMVLNLITNTSIEENFIIAIDHSQATTRLADKVRRLSIHFSNVEDATPPTNMRLSQVRTLAFSGVLKCVSFITGFRLVRVLILHIWGDEDSITVNLNKISELVRLRYLKVSSNVTLKLPTQMQGLQNLETMKIDGKICAVPSDIIHLPGLLHLSLPAKTNLPNGIFHLISLRTLGYFDLGCNSIENMWSLGDLTNLQDLQLTYSTAHSDDLKNYMQCLGSILEKLKSLKSITLSRADPSDATLHIESAIRMRISVDGWSNLSSPPALLQRIELLPCVCIFSSIPNWIGQLGNLCILKIGIREITSTDVDVLGRLPALAVLSLYVHRKPMERIIFDNVGFSILEYFKFRCIVAWMKFEAGAMPNLQKLKLGFDVRRADQHGTIPVGIKHLSGLKEISAKIRVACTVDDLCKGFAESELTNAIRMHPGRPRVNIRCIDWTFDGKDDNNVGTREEESTTFEKQHHIVKVDSTVKFAVPEKDPGREADKSIDRRYGFLTLKIPYPLINRTFLVYYDEYCFYYEYFC
uniref:Uncharacterized protein n=1 Tax=Oryza rufipogon TaxID=4529 RepID=A0A0E0PNZ9_ORYRU